MLNTLRDFLRLNTTARYQIWFGALTATVVVATVITDDKFRIPVVVIGAVVIFLVRTIHFSEAFEPKNWPNKWRNRKFSKDITGFEEALRKASRQELKSLLGDELKKVEPIYLSLVPPDVHNLNEDKEIDVGVLLHDVGLIGSEIENEVIQARAEVLTPLGVNQPHALVFDDTLPDGILPAESVVSFRPADYTLMKAILAVAGSAKTSTKVSLPRVLGAGGLLVHRGKTGNGVLIQQRAAVGFLPGAYHVFGGNFVPNLGRLGQIRDHNLKENAVREIKEETGCTVSVEGTITLIHKERATQFGGAGDPPLDQIRQADFPVHFLGVEISEEQKKIALDRSVNPEEGYVISMDLETLTSHLISINDWVPAGWTTVMLWLYLGSPGKYGRPVFKTSDAKAAFNEVLGAMP